MSHPYAAPAPPAAPAVAPESGRAEQSSAAAPTNAISSHPRPVPPPHPPAPLSSADSRSLPSEHDGDDDKNSDGDDDGEGHRSSCSTSDTVVSRTDDVSSSSAATSHFSARSPSHESATSSSSAASQTKMSDRSALASGPQDEAGHGSHHHHQHQHHHNTHREQVRHLSRRHVNVTPHDDPTVSHTNSGTFNTGSTRLHRLRRVEEPEGYMGSSDTSGPNRGDRVQTSELTRFTRVLAAGAGAGGGVGVGAGSRGTAQLHPLHHHHHHHRGSHSGASSDVTTSIGPDESASASSQQQQQQRWWRRSGEGPATPTQRTDPSLSLSVTTGLQAAAATANAHPYHARSPSDLGGGSFPSFSPSPVRRFPDCSSDDATTTSTPPLAASSNTAATSANAGALPSMPNPHTQRPASVVSPVLHSTAPNGGVAFVNVMASTPLPPTHPRRSASAQSRTSNSPISGGFVVSTHRTSPLHPKSHTSSGAVAAITQSPTARHGTQSGSGGGGGAAAPVYATPTTLRRSSSFTAGVLPPAGSWAAEGDCAHPYLISVSPPLSAVVGHAAAAVTPRVHERTSSVASSVHSASSSARPSVPLPPSHVGPASNMMAAVWVDLPVSQPGSRCATPINSTQNTPVINMAGGGDAAQQQQQQQQQQHRRRRTTPRSRSEPPSPATSTLAASIASSLDGGGYTSSSAAAAALASVRMHHVTTGTQTDSLEDVVLGPLAGTPTAAAAAVDTSFEGVHTPEKRAMDADGREEHAAVAPSRVSSAIALPPTAASVSSTSAEVSPRSFRVSTADPTFDEGAAAMGEGQPASRSSGRSPRLATATDVPDIASGRQVRDGTDTELLQATQHQETVARADALAPPPPPLPAMPSAEEEGAESISFAPSAVADGAASPTGLVVSPVTPELQALHRTPPTLSAGEAVLVEVASNTGEEQNAAAVNITTITTTTTSTAAAAAAAPHLDVSPSAAQVDEVQQLRMELAQMRTQYAQVLRQLNQMHEVGGVRTSAPTGAAEGGNVTSRVPRIEDVEDVSAVSRSPSTSSSFSSSSSSSASALSALLTGEAGTSPITPPPTAHAAAAMTSSSDAEAAATLQHVREALQRTRHRTNP